MTTEFKGTALPLDRQGISDVCDRMGAKDAELWAVLTVETSGCGFLADRRPKILFERHMFSRETGSRFDASNPDISNRTPGGYGADGANQYNRLQQALALDRKAALRSASWGIGQVMGFNAEIAGYSDVEELVDAMKSSEDEQLRAMAGMIIHNSIHKALSARDWPAFARGYNGPEYAKNNYDTRLAAAYQKYALGPLPDIDLRAAQIYLTYLGYQPGPIDGVPGRLTYSALNDFQRQNGLSVTNEINADILSVLKDKALSANDA
jgi:hypothetical protein